MSEFEIQEGIAIIPEGTTEIPCGAFQDCAELKSVTLPEGVTTICYEAFRDCKSLKEVVLPKTLTSIGDSAFAGCESLKTIVLHEGLQQLDSFAFCETGLTEVQIPASITSINKSFQECPNLERIVVAEGNTVYDSRENCNAIIETDSNMLILGCANTVVPHGIEGIDTYAFSRCAALTHLVLPESVTSIAGHAFENCGALQEIVLPNGLNFIGGHAFKNCSALTAITIPGGVEELFGETFWGCTQLKHVVLSEGVSQVTAEAFLDCPALEAVTLPTTIKNFSKIYKCSGVNGSPLLTFYVPAKKGKSLENKYLKACVKATQTFWVRLDGKTFDGGFKKTPGFVEVQSVKVKKTPKKEEPTNFPQKCELTMLVDSERIGVWPCASDDATLQQLFALHEKYLNGELTASDCATLSEIFRDVSGEDQELFDFNTIKKLSVKVAGKSKKVTPDSLTWVHNDESFIDGSYCIVSYYKWPQLTFKAEFITSTFESNLLNLHGVKLPFAMGTSFTKVSYADTRLDYEISSGKSEPFHLKIYENKEGTYTPIVDIDFEKLSTIY